MTTGVEISKRLLLINSISSALRRIIAITVLVWLHQYLVRQVSPGELKIYGLVVPTMMLTPLLTAVCGSGLRRYVINAYAKGDTSRVTMMVLMFTRTESSLAVQTLMGMALPVVFSTYETAMPITLSLGTGDVVGIPGSSVRNTARSW